MQSIEEIKAKIRHLYETNPTVRMSVKMSRPKITIDNALVTIKGVYPNIFRIEETDSGFPRYHSIQYTELLVGRVIIHDI